MKSKIYKLLGILLLLAHIGILGFFWWQNNGASFSRTTGTLFALGRLSGLILASLILAQFLLMSRAPWLEKAWGLDRIAVLHKKIGKWVILPLLLHPTLIVMASTKLNETTFFKQFIASLKSNGDLLQASIATGLLIFVILYSVLMVWRKWEFEKWYLAHLCVYLAIILSFGHQRELGRDFARSNFLDIYWLGLYIFIFTHVILFRFVRPVWLLLKHRFTIQEITQETHDVTSIAISGKSLASLKTAPGQFFIWRFLQKGYISQAHPFSISNPAPKDSLRISAKAVGDFTKTLGGLKKGTKVLVEGPFGTFTPLKTNNSKLLLIAGGIGITPLRSMLDTLLEQKRSVALICANKASKDIVFGKELAALSKKYSTFKVFHVLSDEPTYSGEKGFVNAGLIKKLVPDAKERAVYLCGPPAMMNFVKKELRTIEIPANKIFTEEFVL